MRLRAERSLEKNKMNKINKRIIINSSNYKYLKSLSFKKIGIYNVIIASDPIISNMARFDIMINSVYGFLDDNEAGLGVWLENFPFCVLSKNARDHILDRAGKKGEKKKVCRGCRYFKECSGFPAGYFKKFGSDELCPISDVPEEVMIEIEARCNFKCEFCFNKISFAKNGRNIKRLDPVFVEKIIDEIAKAGIKTVRFTGGEPLLYPDIVDVIKYAKNKGLEVRLNTNGYLVNKKFVRKIKGAIDNVLIPIAGWSNREEENVTGIKDAMHKKISAIKLFKKSGIPVVRVGTVSTKSAIDNFYKIKKIIFELPIDEWELYRPIREESFSNEDVKKIVSMIDKARKNSPMFISLANSIPFCSVEEVNLINSISSGALYDEGHRRMVIDVRGFVKPHYYMDRNIGNPLDLMSAWNHPFMKKIRQLKFVPKECQKCLFVKKCCGGSRYSAQLANGSYSSDDPLADHKNIKFYQTIK